MTNKLLGRKKLPLFHHDDQLDASALAHYLYSGNILINAPRVLFKLSGI